MTSPQPDDRSPSVQSARRGVYLAALLGWYAFAGGLVTVLGWMVGVRRLTAWGGAISMQPNTAVAAAAVGAGLVLLTRGHRRSLIPCAVSR